MNIWITTDWEISPLDGMDAQLGRMNRLAMYLSSVGWNVTLWFTTYNHPLKKYVKKETTFLEVSKNFRLILLHSPFAYKKNTSPARFLYYGMLAREMRRMIEDEDRFPRPDIIFCSYPTEQFCRVACDYGKENRVPVIIDARDQWPDIFSRAFPDFARPLTKILLMPFKKKTARVFASSTSICAMSPKMLNWALKYAGREANALDRFLFIPSKKMVLEEESAKKAIKKWENLGVSSANWNICLFSSLSKSALDVDTVIEAVISVHKIYSNIRFIIGGTGDDESRLREMTEGISYILMPGWLSQEEMTSLMSISKIGMLCYRNTEDFRDGWGNKVGQYFSYGLPILTSAAGYAREYCEQYGCGMAYREKDESQLAEILIDLMKHPQKIKKMSRAASERFNEDFNESIVMGRFQSMIEEAILSYHKGVVNEHIADKSLCRIHRDGDGIPTVLFSNKMDSGESVRKLGGVHTSKYYCGILFPLAA